MTRDELNKLCKDLFISPEAYDSMLNWTSSHEELPKYSDYFICDFKPGPVQYPLPKRGINVDVVPITKEIAIACGLMTDENIDYDQSIKDEVFYGGKRCNCTNNQLMWGGCICGGV